MSAMAQDGSADEASPHAWPSVSVVMTVLDEARLVAAPAGVEGGP